MSDQKAMKKRLKVLMNLPENQVCSDCSERSPRWASLIVPPPGAPPGSLKIGAFSCLECSGAHRRLGVHIAFVRSINLDSWKEEEVRAMENGGNAKVNAIFEARLQQSGVSKPTNHANGQTRERYIRDKYERRKFYDPAAFDEYSSNSIARTPQQQQQRNGPKRSVGPVSDAARQRLERRSRLGKSNSMSSNDSSQDERPSRSISRDGSRKANRGVKKKQIPKAPASAPPPSVDFLDFTSTPTLPTGGNSKSNIDLLAFEQPSETKNSTCDNVPPQSRELPSNSAVTSDSRPAVSEPKQQKTSSSVSQDILSLYGGNSSQQPQAFGAGNAMNNTGMMMMNNGNTMNNMANTMAMMQQMNLQQQPQGNVMMQQQQPNMSQQQRMMLQQQQQQMVMQQRQMMMQQQNSNSMQQQQMMLMQQQAQQQQMNNMMMMQGMSPGGPVPTGSNGNSKQPAQQDPVKKDPFAQFGHNAFRP